MSNELSGKVAIITGAAKGIGQASAELFVEEGAKVVIADVDENRGSDGREQVGPRGAVQATDVSKRDDIQALVDFTVAEFGGLHVMCNMPR